MIPELIKLDKNTILDRTIKGQWERQSDGSVGLDDYQGKGFLVVFHFDQATRLWNELCKACGKVDLFPKADPFNPCASPTIESITISGEKFVPAKPSVEPIRDDTVFDRIRGESRQKDQADDMADAVMKRAAEDFHLLDGGD